MSPNIPVLPIAGGTLVRAFASLLALVTHWLKKLARARRHRREASHAGQPRPPHARRYRHHPRRSARRLLGAVLGRPDRAAARARDRTPHDRTPGVENGFRRPHRPAGAPGEEINAKRPIPLIGRSIRPAIIPSRGRIQRPPAPPAGANFFYAEEFLRKDIRGLGALTCPEQAERQGRARAHAASGHSIGRAWCWLWRWQFLRKLARRRRRPASTAAAATTPAFQIRTGDPAVCAARCERDARCRAWSFSYPRTANALATCWLKNKVPPRVWRTNAACRACAAPAWSSRARGRRNFPSTASAATIAISTPRPIRPAPPARRPATARTTAAPGPMCGPAISRRSRAAI